MKKNSFSHNVDEYPRIFERDTPLENNTDPFIVPVEVQEETTHTLIPIPLELTDNPDYEYFVVQRDKIRTTIITRITNIEPIPNSKESRITSSVTRIEKRKTKSFLFSNKRRRNLKASASLLMP